MIVDGAKLDRARTERLRRKMQRNGGWAVFFKVLDDSRRSPYMRNLYWDRACMQATSGTALHVCQHPREAELRLRDGWIVVPVLGALADLVGVYRRGVAFRALEIA